MPPATNEFWITWDHRAVDDLTRRAMTNFAAASNNFLRQNANHASVLHLGPLTKAMFAAFMQIYFSLPTVNHHHIVWHGDCVDTLGYLEPQLYRLNVADAPIDLACASIPRRRVITPPAVTNKHPHAEE
jgi:hypothetical protein